ncbi:4'-phosphopantetheinyl transferase family protein [Puniceibacterium sediminis]|uniref:4'-phosphopantetheinyl transferase superfamily protein n=1 Tax=Puniceibacterium sediminis TaxID=1608407 RepID=A0A238ZBK7_9RHOB|nr:4'-phosphopantetheinyl transferase superfamily protein [Puniceibacterium sediminis]
MDLAPKIFRPEELAIVTNTLWAHYGSTRLFLAKEAVFKAVHPTVNRFVDFHEVRLRAMSAEELYFGVMPTCRPSWGINARCVPGPHGGAGMW